MPQDAAHSLNAPVSDEPAGIEMLELMRTLYPICRSLTGEGVRETLRLVGEVVPLEVTEVPSDTAVFDWKVPREWNIQDAWIADSRGRRIVDFRESNLHVLGYSTPVRTTMTGAELQPRLYSLPEHPDWVPMRTAYWAETWGFCLSEKQRQRIDPDEEYDVCIDTTLGAGHLTYAEAWFSGETEAEVLLSTYICHPSLCNDNLSGIVLLAQLGRELRHRRLHYSYRLLFSPGTLGPLAWLSREQNRIDRIAHGLVVSCVGDPGPVRYKRSRKGDAPIDRAAGNVLRHRDATAMVEDFVPWGGDERQFCSPGFNLPVGALTRTPHGLFPEYHTSADNLDFVRAESLEDSLAVALGIIDVLERNCLYRSLYPYGEPQLGRRGLYREVSAGVPRSEEQHQRAILWVLSLGDGAHSLLDVAERADLPFAVVAEAAAALEGAELITKAGE